MPKVTVYSTMLCPYCFMAKKLLNKKGVEFEEIDVGRQPELRQDMTERAGGRYTVPQIFIGDVHVGGCDDLHEAERSGRLDELLAQA
ncbi:MAG: glutaredoxin 3 [Hyphomicrobiaceae bacterium]|nr:glutaredoxin 3 [Hyphomicrobiaceae bacterium]